MKVLLLLSLFLISLFEAATYGKTISEGIEYTLSHGRTVNSENHFALHASYPEAFLTNQYRIAKFGTQTLSYMKEVSGLEVFSLLPINNNTTTLLLAVSDKEITVFDTKLSQVETSTWNLPVFKTVISGAINSDKLYVCDTRIFEGVFFYAATYNSSFYFQDKILLGNLSFPSGNSFTCGQIIVDHATGKVWSYVRFERLQLEGLSLYLVDSPLKKVILQLPSNPSDILGVDVNNNVVAVSAFGGEAYLYIFDIPENFEDEQYISNSAKVLIGGTGSFVQIHDFNGEIYEKRAESKDFNIYRRSKDTIKLIDTYNLPLDESYFYALSFLPNRTHGYLLGGENVYRFPIPRYDRISSISSLNLPSFQTLFLLLSFLLFSLF